MMKQGLDLTFDEVVKKLRNAYRKWGYCSCEACWACNYSNFYDYDERDRKVWVRVVDGRGKEEIQLCDGILLFIDEKGSETSNYVAPWYTREKVLQIFVS